MQLPFDDVAVKELVEANLVLSMNDANSPMFYGASSLSVGESGYEVADGVLRVLDGKGGLRYEFRGLETRNGVVYIVGQDVWMASRMTLHKRVPLSDNFGICVSSHVTYEKDSVPVLLASLKSNGFNTERVLVVVGGEKDDKHGVVSWVDPNFGSKIVRSKRQLLGFVSLAEHEHMESFPYWMLLHDTCGVEKGFVPKVSDIDIGLRPDMVLLCPSLEIGLYSVKFLQQHMDSSPSAGVTSRGYLQSLTARANVAVVLDAPMTIKPEKDIYGTGVKRESLVFSSLGIVKYRGKVVSGGKP